MGRKYRYKSAGDMRAMIPAGLATAHVLEKVSAAVRPGVTTRELDDVARESLAADGATSNFILEPGYRHTICVSINDQIVHGVPGDRVVEPGDIVSVDAGAIIAGWNGDAAVTIVVPGGDHEVATRRQRLSEVTEGSLWAGIAALAHARAVNQVGGAVERFLRSSGNFGILREYVGHGIGLSMHEENPEVPVFNYSVRERGVDVKPGLTICIEPMVTNGGEDTYVTDDDWTVVTADHSDGAHWEHSIAVTDGGVWVLTAEDGGAAKLANFGITPVRP